MKKTILMTMFCILSNLTMQAAEYQYLVFTMSDNTTTAITASNLTISFSNGSLIATSGSSTLATLTLADIQKMEFSNEGSATGIQTISANSLISDKSTIVYDLNGRQVSMRNPLPRGLYIVKNSKGSFKLQVK